jgi:putative DNA primase/helicase
MVYGPPGTGKSVLLRLLEIFIGLENRSSESIYNLEEDKYRSANLYGKRLNVCSDMPSTKLHKTEMFKKLVSGLDSVDAEKKFQPSFTFYNIAKLAFSSNKLPDGPKDPAFYERFNLIELANKFRGTKKDDRQLIHKLTTDTELSGLLNLALEGLKRLYKNDNFSYNKTFEETEREYILNSNPTAIFMEERTVVSDQDIDATVLYISYVDWSHKNRTDPVSKIEFSRKLKNMGYTNRRDNVPGSYSTKKIILWDNLQLKIDGEKNLIGQDLPKLGQDLFGTSCPNQNLVPITKNRSEYPVGQDLFSVVVSNEKNNTKKEVEKKVNYEKINNVKKGKSEKIAVKSNNRETSCPTPRFFDSGSIGQDVFEDLVLSCPGGQKNATFEIDDESNSIKNITDSDLLRKDLKNFAKSSYNYVVENVPVFVGEFNKKYPGHKQRFGLDAVLSNAERLKERGWK